MKRNDFINTTATFFAAGLLPSHVERIMRGNDGNSKNDDDSLPVIPPYLKKGDVVGITAPAGCS